MSFYTAALRPLLFRLDAEAAHHLAIHAAAALKPLAPLLRPRLTVDDPALAVEIAGLRFPNPLGLAAGFDKSGTAVDLLAALGFGSIEIGSVSLDASRGNPRPRLWRLAMDEAILVAYGLPNDGARAVAARLATTILPVPLGINIVKTNRGPATMNRGSAAETPDQIIADYAGAARILAPHADYLMFNLSCPNTADGRDFFADAAHLRDWLAAIADLSLDKPVFLKVSPLGGPAAIDRLLAAVDRHRFVRGFMFNLPPTKPAHLQSPQADWLGRPGAVSGPPAATLADAGLAELYRRMDRRRFALFAAGGIRTAEEAYAKIRLGASMLQLLTALVYRGPGAVRTILQGLPPLLARDGFRTITEAVGIDALNRKDRDQP
jgi:dihydroorotate dehydrogenase